MVTVPLPYKPLTTVRDIRSVVRVRQEYADHEEKLLDIMASTRCVLRGHFALLSGQHSDYFLRFRSVAGKRSNVDYVASLLRQKLDTVDFDTILAPETAGSILARALADQFSLAHGPVIVPTDEKGHPVERLGTGVLRSGERVLVVNDLVTAGRGLRRLIQLVQYGGARVAGVVLFANRHSDGPLAAIENPDFEVYYLMDLEVDHYGLEGGPTGAASCRLCETGADDLVESHTLN